MYNDIIVDAKLAKEDALKQNPDFLCPEEIIVCQQVIEVLYYSFDGKLHQGQIVVHEELVEDIRNIFKVILEERFPLTSVIPVADPRFHWDDGLSIQANNSSGFNYRTKTLKNELSNHAYGRAVDLNPRLNPYIKGDYV